ncbi:MAG: HAMP domain-containing protein [Clostridiales bacterium]|nr:HAMP domain-containing protein [Clostridiales bacterium]
MRHSIWRRMTIFFSVVLTAAIVLCWLMNNFFLERYYVHNKQMVLTGVYDQMNDASGNGVLESEEFVQQLNTVCESNNISLFVMGSDGKVKLYSMKDYKLMKERLYAFLFGRTQETERVLEESDHYTVRMNSDAYTNGEYLEMVGILGGGEVFLIRTALEPIRESVVLANRFLAYVGIAAVLMGGLIIRVLSKRIAEPLLELAKLSERMSNLDFDVKFRGGKDDEIAFLGHHMNQLSEALERTISELKTANNELQRDIRQRERSDEMRKEFLSNVSHELKTPIALIQGYAEGLQECINDDPESRSFYCDVIMDEAGKMNTMVRNLLNLNELEFGKEVVEMERFDVAAMIRNMLQASRILFEQKQVRLIFDVQEPVYVWANEYKLGEVMNNYISNALNHVAGENIIKITVEKKDDLVRVGVFNTGQPIPEQDIDKIWDKFYKVDKARTREYGGSGVGLSIVKAIMDSLHRDYGVINYENGVEFWLELDYKA